MTTQEMLLTIGVVSFVVYTICMIIFLIEFIRISSALRAFIKRAEDNLHPAIATLKRVLEDVGSAAENIITLTGNVQKIASLVGVVQKIAKTLYGSYTEGLSESTRANIAGLKAGIKTGVSTMVRNLRDKKKEG